ncbi:MAG: zinc dependent phospholipase C family protein [Spirochaetia bacterium]|nr:zinc dependent phospholipase C family protein [Spirochaetia bacterium]
MAGTFTHWMVVENAMDSCFQKSNRHAYFQYLLKNNHFVMLGAVSPDLPYLTELLAGFIKEHSWADRMHYENTGKIVSLAVKNIGISPESDQAVLIPWIAGYVTHLVTDAIIHPIVNAIVGPYIFNSGEHRHCEMIQDAIIFHEIKNLELGYAEYSDLLENCSVGGSQLNPALQNFWKKCLQDNYPSAASHFNKINPAGWHNNYMSTISGAARPAPIFRHIGESANLAYKYTSEISTQERDKFYNKANLPGGGTGNFKQAGFDKAVAKVVEIWDLLFQDIQGKNPGNCSKYIKNWNLDTGVDEDQPDLWKGV